MALSNAQRVAVAKDVKKWIKTLNIGQFGYCNIKGEEVHYLKYSEEEASKSLIRLIKDRLLSCHCCARGAMFIAMVDRFNKIKNSEILRNSSQITKDWTVRYFGRDQAELIETAFERGNFTSYKDGSQEVHDAIDFGLKYYDPKKRLNAIMNNIIRNGGRFIP